MKFIVAPVFFNNGSRYLTRVNQAINLLDDQFLELGTNQDGVLTLSSGAVAADAEVTGLIEGTSAHLGHAANSVVLSNITDDGDIHILVSKGGNSHTAFLADGSTGDTILNAATGQSVDLYVAGTKEYDFSATDADFNSNTLSNVGVAGNDWTANRLTLINANTGGTSQINIVNTATSGTSYALVQISVDEDSTGDPLVQFAITDGTGMVVGIDNSDSDIAKWSRSGGLGTNDAFRMTAATPPVITYNTTHPTGTFDYVCGTCGHHRESEFMCHGQMAEWQDDVMVFRSMVLREESGIDQMVKVGVMERTVGTDGSKEVFTTLGPDWVYVGSMAYQNRVRMDAQYENLDQRLRALEA